MACVQQLVGTVLSEQEGESHCASALAPKVKQIAGLYNKMDSLRAGCHLKTAVVYHMEKLRAAHSLTTYTVSLLDFKLTSVAVLMGEIWKR